MKAKCFMQLLWTKGLKWDEKLPPDLANQWNLFLDDTAKHLSSVKIDRVFPLSNSQCIEIHGFADASENGFAAVVYFKCEQYNSEPITRLVISKTRVAPLKKVTIPRLELCAAHLLSKLVDYCVKQFHSVTFSDIVLWSDSTVTLSWLQTPPYKLKTYVANRVAQIQELFSVQRWRHVPGTCNPADCASRGLLASQLTQHQLWWFGPPWLLSDQPLWPTSTPTVNETELSEEMKPTPTVVLQTSVKEPWDLFLRFSSWHKLTRIIAYMLRFVNNCKSQTSKHSSKLLLASELKNAKLRIFKIIQSTEFNIDFQLLKKQKPCTSKLRRLNPFIDSDDIIRVGGRLTHSSLKYDSRHPVILPKRHPCVDLLIDAYHQLHLHAGPQLTQSMLCQEVWILSARSIIRTRIFKCMICFKSKPKNRTPLMGDLPSTRVKPARPFDSTGVDYAGPFSARVHNLKGLRQIKVYLCIFICMTTKAVHLELVTDLTTEGFIAALTRFVSRRGLCSTIFSDCGTNFVGANTTLRKILLDTVKAPVAKDKISLFSTNRGIDFKFNPPSAPHQGGLWESAVKSAKYHLTRVMGDTILTLSQFMTLITQIEAMLNSRPLTPLSSDPSDVTALTPGHFLIGAPLAALPEPQVQDIPNNRLRHWQLTQALHQRIWQRWKTEYLHSLQQRVKWTSPGDTLKIGDLVLIQAPTSPLNWPLGRVIQTHPGSDGIVRVATLKTANGTLTRPTVKLFPLPMD